MRVLGALTSQKVSGFTPSNDIKASNQNKCRDITQEEKNSEA